MSWFSATVMVSFLKDTIDPSRILSTRKRFGWNRPVLAFVLSDNVLVPASSIELEPGRRAQLDEFKNEVIRPVSLSAS